MYTNNKDPLIENQGLKDTEKMLDDLELKKLAREDRIHKKIISRAIVSRKQRGTIHLLEGDISNIITNLEMMTTERQCSLQTEQAGSIAQFLAQKDELDKELAREKSYIKDLQLQIRKESKKVGQYQKQMKTTVIKDNNLEESNKAEAKNDSMKSRLHVEQLHLGTVTTENAELRRRIEKQLKDRARFNQVFEELLAKLTKGKIVLSDAVEQAQIQLKKRDDITNKINALKKRDNADMKRRREEMQELDMKLYDETMFSVYKKALMVERTQLVKSLDEKSGMKMHRVKNHEKLKKLIESWEKIKEHSGLEDCKEVCDLILHNDAENFSLLNYNNELRYQVEAMTERTAELVRKLDDEEDLLNQREDEGERNKLDMERLLHELVKRVNVESDEYQTNQRTIQRLFKEIDELFEVLKCDPSPLQQLLGNNEEVTEFNFHLYLRLVESRVKELLEVLPQESDPNVVTASKAVIFSQKSLGSLTPKHLDDKKMVVNRNCSECEEFKRKPGVLLKT